jgi:hypothetical protein
MYYLRGFVLASKQTRDDEHFGGVTTDLRQVIL